MFCGNQARASIRAYRQQVAHCRGLRSCGLEGCRGSSPHSPVRLRPSSRAWRQPFGSSRTNGTSSAAAVIRGGLKHVARLHFVSDGTSETNFCKHEIVPMPDRRDFWKSGTNRSPLASIEGCAGGGKGDLKFVRTPTWPKTELLCEQQFLRGRLLLAFDPTYRHTTESSGAGADVALPSLSVRGPPVFRARRPLLARRVCRVDESLVGGAPAFAACLGEGPHAGSFPCPDPGWIP
jgi:hypothetical protein